MKRWTWSRRSLVAAGAGAALLVGASTVAVSTAIAADHPTRSSRTAPTDDKDGTLVTSVPDPEELARQEKLDSSVDPLLTSELLEVADGYGGSAVDYDDFAFDLWWRGEVPDDVQAVLDGFGEVEVRLHDAVYTRRELEAAATRVAARRSGRFVVGAVVVESLARPTPVHGIEAELRRRSGISDDAIAAELTEVAGLPVTVSHDRSIPAVGTLPDR